MIDHDRIFKELIKAFFVEFIELFFPEMAAGLDRDSVEFLDKQIFTDVTEGEEHEADLVAKARWRGEPSFFLFHVEPQSTSRSNFPRRMFTYFARLHEAFGLPVFPIAVLTYEKPMSEAPAEYRVAFPAWDVLTFKYRVVQLNRLPWRDFLRNENPVATALMSKMRIPPEERKAAKLECLRLLLTLRLDPARMRLIAGFVNTYLKLQPVEEQWVLDEIKAIDPSQKEKLMLFWTHWHEEGMQAGVQQGMQAGIQAGMQQEALGLAERLLRRRLGEPLTEGTRDQLRRLATEQLEELSEALLDFHTITDLDRWLDSHRTSMQSP